MLATDVIKQKRSQKPLSTDQIDFFIGGYTKGDIPDYQMSSLLMAIFLNGMNESEISHLTKCMIQSGTQIEFENLFAVDKHSTGGVGDKTSLILAPLVAACGVPVPMMSGRGLGHTGGTLDKLESIPGFQVNIELENFKKQVEKNLLCFIGQTEDICPADKKIYSLRDVTGTVESLPLICASIMSKKIAEGIKGLVLDVKMGSGAFMKNLDEAKALANGLLSIGQSQGLKIKAFITDMNQPLGRFVGNAVEVGECLSILKREPYLGIDHSHFSDTEELSVHLASHMVAIGLNCSIEEASQKVQEALESGRAYEKFNEVCKIQNGDISQLPRPSKKIDIAVEKSGYLEKINCEQIGIAGINIKAGRKLITDQINPVNGIEIHKKIGDSISSGETLFSVHMDDEKEGLEKATEILKNCYSISDHKVQTNSLIMETLS